MAVRFVLPAALALAAALALPHGAVAADARGDATAGAAIFKTRCIACHVIGAGQAPMLAPNLRGVVGRKAASTGFANYSPALKASGLTWAKGNLETFLAAPMKMVPGTRMVINISDAQQRADVIAYLATLK
jgi:cytochrome c